MYLWDSNVLQHFWQNNPTIQEHIHQIGWKNIALPSAVVAETLRGRCDFAIKASPEQLPLAHQHMLETQQLLQQFQVIPFNSACAQAMKQLQQKTKSRKRYADMIIAATVLAGWHILVTRNQKHFVDLLPKAQCVNWVDEPPH
jgi:predicted nucleic acid-binding protein